MADSGLLRGVALVDAVMKFRRDEGEKLEGMPPDDLAATSLGEVPLTPALRRWLEQDAEMFELGEPQSLEEFLDAELSEFADAFEPLSEYLTAKLVVFQGWGADSRRAIYLGKKDAAGEYPVLTFDVDDVPFACINGPVDVWLAQQAGFLDEEEAYGHVPDLYEPARRAQAKLNFGGYLAFVDGELSSDLTGE
jgi:hypothetical protein